jgi:hypothetical protein
MVKSPWWSGHQWLPNRSARPWRLYVMTIQSHLSPGSELSTPGAKSVQDDTNSNYSNRKVLSSTLKALLISDALAGKDLIQPGQKLMASLYSIMSM